MINRIRNASILSQLVFAFLIIGLLPLVIVILITFNSSQRLIQEEVQQRLRATSDGKVSQIETYAQERIQDVFALTKIPTIIEAIDALNTLITPDAVQTTDYTTFSDTFRQLLRPILEGTNYENVLLFSADGTLLFSELPTDTIGQNYPQLYPDTPLVQTLNNALTLLETEISSLTFADNTQNQVLYISAPVFSEGKVMGMVTLQLDSSDFFSAISDRTGLGLSKTGESIAIFEEDEAVVFTVPRLDENSTILTPVESLDAIYTRPLLDAVRGIQGEGVVEDYRGQPVIAVWSYLPSLRWGLMVKIDTSEAFSAIQTQQNLVFGLSALTLVAVIGFSYTLANSLSRPIEDLVRATKTVAQGVYENKIAVKGTGEIAQLVDAFDLLIQNTIKQRTTELERVAEQERENSRLKDEFLAIMSHELRTPLNAIIGFVGIVQMSNQLDEKNRHRLERVRINADRLLALINDILDISRIESGRIQVFKRETDIRAFFTDLHAQMQSLAEEKSLQFTVSVAEDMPQHILTDKELMSKIFINLIGNALKFTETGGVEIQVTRNGTNWIGTVKDTGIGIPAHMHETIFERFRQVDSSATRKHSGTGLGLSIVNSLVKTLGGKLWLESVLEQGTTFFVSLPIEIADVQLSNNTMAESS